MTKSRSGNAADSGFSRAVRRNPFVGLLVGLILLGGTAACSSSDAQSNDPAASTGTGAPRSAEEKAAYQDFLTSMAGFFQVQNAPAVAPERWINPDDRDSVTDACIRQSG